MSSVLSIRGAGSRVLVCAMTVVAMCVAAGAQPATAPTSQPTPLQQARLLLQSKEYAKASAALDDYLKLRPKDAPEAAYLKALALHYAGEHAKAIEAAQAVVEQYKDSGWVRKALFVKAASLSHQKKYKEAEEIYEAEASRLLGEARKKEIAGVIAQFADALMKKPEPTDVGAPPPNYPKAHELYVRVLSMEIGRDLRDEVMFKAARASQLAGNFGQAINEWHAYLAEFDPDWTGPVGSQARTLNQKKQNPPPGSRRAIDARYRLAESQLGAGQQAQARQELEDLQKLMGTPENRVRSDTIAPAEVAWLLVKTYNMPSPGNLLEKAVSAAREFASTFKNHPHAVEAAWWVAEAYRGAGRADQAIAAYEDFIAGKGYGLPAGADALKKYEGRDKSPAELKDEYTKLAVYNIAQIRFGQKQYAKAIEQWQSYVAKYPNGPHWASSQMEIINAEFQMALESVAAKKYDEARKQFDTFLEKHPLDARASQILFIYGQIQYAAGQKLEEDKADKTKIAEAYQKAIDEWSKLVSRFPGNEQASVAQYRIGMIYEEKLGELDKAIEAYRKLNWGSMASSASSRVTVMTQKHLAITTERVFRTNEPVKLKINARNIEKLTVKLYRLDMESYFRKAHGIGAVESLDIALIQPDKTWELKIENYAKYKPIEQELTIPYDEAKPGACLVNVSEEDYEATTLAIRSDLELVLKASRREALVFVQDMQKNAGAADVDLLFSDGQKVFATGKTGKDGVFRAKFDQLKDIDSVRVFAMRGEGDARQRHIAANMLAMAGLGMSSGLSPRGYLYTDRPAYRPGQAVFVGGVIRQVKDGSYVVPKDQSYLVSITDPNGRLLWEEEKKLSEFGTLSAKMLLDDAAAVGSYTLIAKQKLEQGSTQQPLTFSGTFVVQQFQSEKMRVKLEPARTVYFRGEKVELDITAEYYWGSPVAQKQIRYRLPDGREFSQKTDDKGKLKVTFDTTGMTPGTAMTFTAIVEGENVSASTTVLLANLGFNVSVKTNQGLYLAGEPFEATVKTTTPDGKPMGTELTLIVLRRQVTKADPVLSGVPWVSIGAQPAAEQTVTEVKVKTDEKTGIGTAKLNLDQGGMYVLRATGKDRFEQVVTGEGYVNISDASDEIKLRFFADSDTLKVGEKAAIRLHSRLGKAIALVTFEGEDILDYRIVELKKDYNPIDLPVGHQHFPNFTISAAAMDAKLLRFASRSFSVERELKVTIKPQKQTYAPGEQAKVEIVVTDQLGKPVKAELSLAMVDEALLSVFADNTPKILDFFQSDARRVGEFRVATSVGYTYVGSMRGVVKAFQEEADRIARGEDDVRRMKELEGRLHAELKQLEEMQKAVNQSTIRLQRARNGVATQPEPNGRELNGDGQVLLGDNNNFSGVVQVANGTLVVNQGGNINNTFSNSGALTVNTVDGGTLSQQLAEGLVGGIAPNMPAAQSGRQAYGSSGGKPAAGRYLLRSSGKDRAYGTADDVLYFFGDAASKGDMGRAAREIRREIPEAGFWAPAIVTDDAGKATITIPMPDTTSSWKMTSRGVTVETLVGEAGATVATRKDFFVELKSPLMVQEGDKVRLLARVHNLGDFEGEAAISLVLTDESSGKKIADLSQKVQIKKQSSGEVLFDAVEIPAAARLKAELSGKAGKSEDALTRSIGVRPWGMEYAATAGGTATGDAMVTLALPEDQKYTSQWMTIAIGPSIQRAIIDLALGGAAPIGREGDKVAILPPGPQFGGSTGSELLAAVSALEYAKTIGAPQTDYQRLLDRSRSLVGALVTSQRPDGGWIWFCHGSESNWASTSISYWALHRARAAGIAVNEATIANAQNFLQTAFTKVGANDNDAKAVILHALSVGGAADFANVNRLYRERNVLNNPALAYTTLALANLNRMEIAGEVLEVLLGKARTSNVDGRAVTQWEPTKAHPWLNDRIETTAVTLLAIARVKPLSEKAREAAEYLLHERGCHGYPLAKSNGLAISALAAYYGKAKHAAAEYQLAIEVNGKPFKTIDVKAEQSSMLLSVSPDLIAKGANKVTFAIKGKGELTYAVTLRGFSPDIKDPGTIADLKFRARSYYHAPLEYRGRSIGVESTSPVTSAEIGQRVSVKIAFEKAWKTEQYMVIEEPLPAGAVLVEGSVRGQFRQVVSTPSKLTFFYAPGDITSDLQYEVVGYSTGQYRTLPTVVRDAITPGRMRIGPSKEIVVLAPGAQSKDEYKWNSAERFAMGSLYFNDRLYKEALSYLADLYKAEKAYNERDLARMLLWIHTTADFYDAKQIVAMFEVLRERHPDLVIPFDKMLVVGKGYRDIAEFERAIYVFRAIIDASFMNDSSVSAVLQDEGQFLASVDFQEDLWREYPDSADVVTSYFALSQLLYQKAPEAHLLAKRERKINLARGRTQIPADRVPNRVEMLNETLRMLSSFRAMYPDNPLADDAAFSQANVLLELKDYKAVVAVAKNAAKLYPKSEYASSFQYVGALGFFWQRAYDDALKSAQIVADGESKDRDFARYIVGQIYHAEGKPASAIDWYKKVQDLYPDAKEAIGYFEQTKIGVEEVSIFKPGESPELKIKYRNIKEAAIRVYKVDLMKLYLREKNLANITRVNLSGITPEAEMTLKLGDGRDYVEKETVAKLPVKDEAAYLVICRGDDLFASGVVLITPLKIEVQEDAGSGRVRANVLDSAKNEYVPEVHVKAIGSADSQFKSGQTDLRGIYIADGINGKATLIARLGESRYAFYRGEQWLGQTPAPGAPQVQMKQLEKLNKIQESVDYLENIKGGNKAIQDKNLQQFEQQRRNWNRGVEVQKAR